MQNNLHELMATGNYASEAEIFRQAVAELYRSINPPYLRPSPAGQIKQKKLEKEKAIEAIPDEEFATKNLEDVFIFTDEENNKWVLYRKIGNYVGAVALAEIKDWVKANDPEYNYHKAVAGDPKHLPYDKELENSSVRKHLAEHYGVVISHE